MIMRVNAAEEHYIITTIYITFYGGNYNYLNISYRKNIISVDLYVSFYCSLKLPLSPVHTSCHESFLLQKNNLFQPNLKYFQNNEILFLWMKVFHINSSGRKGVHCLSRACIEFGRIKKLPNYMLCLLCLFIISSLAFCWAEKLASGRIVLGILELSLQNNVSFAISIYNTRRGKVNTF